MFYSEKLVDRLSRTAYINSSAAAYCQREQEVLNDCLVANHYDQTYCILQVYNYGYCANQT